MRLAILIPHMFMHDEVIDNVIFAPGRLGVDLANGLAKLGHEVTLFTPGYTLDGVRNIHPDLTLFEEELKVRGDTYTELLKKHPLIFITLARQVQAELISSCFAQANAGNFDLVHVYTNEEELALIFAQFCRVPVLFTHHEPFNFLTRYRSIFPKYKDKNWVSISLSQQKSMPSDTNFVGNIYHGIESNRFDANLTSIHDYFAYFGRIIEPKGVHIAIAAAKSAGVSLKIAGKHYTGFGNDRYWTDVIEPQIDGKQIQYLGFLSDDTQKQKFLGEAKALLVPSTWEEPFGMVMIEALACGTPIIALESGAIPEIINDGETGFLVPRFENSESRLDEVKIIEFFTQKMRVINTISRTKCREVFELRFTLGRMCREHELLYNALCNHHTT